MTLACISNVSAIFTTKETNESIKEIGASRNEKFLNTNSYGQPGIGLLEFCRFVEGFRYSNRTIIMMYFNNKLFSGESRKVWHFRQNLNFSAKQTSVLPMIFTSYTTVATGKTCFRNHYTLLIAGFFLVFNLIV